MTFSKKEVEKIKQSVRVGEERITATLSASAVEILTFQNPAAQISYQRSGSDLACTVEVSLNGKNWVSITAVAASTIYNYNTSIVKHVRVTHTGGSGKLTVCAR